ncbi:MAG: TVP38/TMEM64 family protein [Bradymonadaceae bacterium]
MEQTQQTTTVDRLQTAGRWILGAILLVGIGWAILNRGELSPGAIREVVEAMGIWGPVGFVGLYIVAALFFVPGAPLTLSAGAVFGPVAGTVYSLIGATVGATIAFVIARYLAGSWVREKVSGRLETIVEGVEDEGWRFVVYTRLVPLFPFNLLNYAYGLTRMRLGPYALASLLAMVPGAAAYAYLGHTGQQLAAGTENAIQTALIAIGALAALALITTVVRRYREEPAEGSA